MNDYGAVQDAVKSATHLRVWGGGSKAALSQGATLELRDLSGVREYTPQEYTFTALAGTPLAVIGEMLAAEGQHLPFDPPFAEAGATLGGTVAAGMSGPGRFRYGGVRDFLLGVVFIDGRGVVVTGGGKVVKNAAGFDFPKLMVGSLGRFGVLCELTFKVFPRPETYATLRLETAFAHANTMMTRLAGSGFETWALELHPTPTTTQLFARFGGLEAALPGRLERVQAFLGSAGVVVTGDAEAQLWRAANTFSWTPPGYALVKIAHSPRHVGELERVLEPFSTPHRYGVGGNVCYLAWPEADRDALEQLLMARGLSGLALTGNWHNPQLGAQTGGAFLRRVESVFDPHGVFALPTEVTDAA